MADIFTRNQIVGDPSEYRPELPVDDLLRMIRLTGMMQVFSHLTAPWACAFPPEEDAIVLHLVTAGKCVAYVTKRDDPIALVGGDALLVTPPVVHTLGDGPRSPAVPLVDLVPSPLKNAGSADEYLSNLFTQDYRFGGGGAPALIYTLRMYLDRRFPTAILQSLPKLVRLPGFVTRKAPFVEQLTSLIGEHGKQGFMGLAIATRLAEGVLTACIKDHLEATFQIVDVGRGLNDPLLSGMLRAIQEDPGRDWTILNLAERAKMSRSAFINRFTRVTGQKPNEFVTSMRMMQAMELLEKSGTPIAHIATEMGYSSEASFTRAFHRWFKVTPGTVRRRQPAGAQDTPHHLTEQQ
ncbi:MULTISPECIES: AraC family transcriptional regulator [Sphingomonadaceae]|uniref:AraC family transcriptional regulator n=1 Tax=Sphingomonadaceae TaxID=41297 RepID=UPI0000DD04FF|nr:MULTISPECIES: AraC family transcriptional regulator [Sphingomonadaceae]QDK35721.1 AraC family transcriptional regulator [Sphingomonas sp. IC081]QSR20492.1 AraC family transcriptional regulator [Novosphingobium sp. KA1]BAF03301.1 helix-turn-helix, AraC type transcriptonal regulator [Novosphingobium sp. KA1]